MSKNGPVAPSARNQRRRRLGDARRFVAAVPEPRRAEIHGALGDDRHVRVDDHGERAVDELGNQPRRHRQPRRRRDVERALHRAVRSRSGTTPSPSPAARSRSPAAGTSRRSPAIPRRSTTWRARRRPRWRRASRSSCCPRTSSARRRAAGRPSTSPASRPPCPRARRSGRRAASPATSAARFRFCVIVVPSSLKKVTTAGAACAFGLAMSTSRSKNEPVDPSASR